MTLASKQKGERHKPASSSVIFHLLHLLHTGQVVYSRPLWTTPLSPGQNSRDPVGCSLGKLVGPLVHGLDRSIAHSLSGLLRRSTKQFDCGFLFHNTHCKQIYNK